MGKLKIRKKLKNRCPHCGSSQIHFRKMLNNWICDELDCKRTFKIAKGDE